jgi:hypothetical protein
MRKGPLVNRLYFQPALYQLARTIGYRVLSVPAEKELIKPLAERYGKERMLAAARDIVHIDSSTDPPTARLTDEVRRLCWQLLGPPPKPCRKLAG